MSGGHFNYSQFELLEILSQVGEDKQVITKWPKLAELFKALGQTLGDIQHDMDWDLSGDTEIKNNEEFQEQYIGKILDIILKQTPDKWFPKGKWATIQAIQSRVARNTCENCNGSGQIDMKMGYLICDECEGLGEILWTK